MSEYTYYCPQRPPAPGAIPDEGLVSIVAFEERQYNQALNRMVWGRATYNRPLTNRELFDYELIKEPMDDCKNIDSLDIRCEIVRRAVRDYKEIVSHRLKPTGRCNISEIELFFQSEYCNEMMYGMGATPEATLKALRKWRDEYLRKDKERKKKRKSKGMNGEFSQSND